MFSAAAIIVVAADTAVVAEQNGNQNDDPPPIVAAPTAQTGIIARHNENLLMISKRVAPFIPCYVLRRNW